MQAQAQHELDALVQRWVSEGIITVEQASRIQADLAATGVVTARVPKPAEAGVQQAGASVPGEAPAERAPASLVSEGLGYLGGVIILVASGLVTARFWPDMSTLTRVVFAGFVTLLFLGAGLAVPSRESPAGARLRGVLWLGSTAAFAGFLGMLGNQSLGWENEALAAFVTGGTALYAAGLWLAHHHPIQHIATFATVVGAVAALATWLPDQSSIPPALAVWGASAVWGLLAWGGLLRPAELGRALGAAGLVIGAMATMSEGWGNVFALATVAAVLTLAMVLRDLVMLAVGTLGALNVLPAAMTRFFPGAIGAALALLAVGLVLVLAALYTARHRRAEPELLARRDLSRGSRRAAMLAAGSLGVVMTALVLVTGVTA